MDEMIYFAIDRLSERRELYFKEFKEMFKKDFLKTFSAETEFLENFGARIKKNKIKTPPKSWNIIRQAFYKKAALMKGVRNIKLKKSFLKNFR